MPKSSRAKLTHIELLLFTKYLSVLLRSGLTIDDSLDILNKQAKGALGVILPVLLTAVRGGKTLSEGLQQFPRTFSSVFVNLVRAGETAGTMQSTLDQLSEQLQKEHDLSQKVRGAMMYPAFVLSAGLIMTIGIVVFILPNITKLFVSLHVELPLSTRIILWISDQFQQHGIAIALVTVLVITGLPTFLRLKAVKPTSHWLLLHTPVLGVLVRNTNLARVTRLLGTLLQSGLPIEEALKIAGTVLRNVQYKTLFDLVQEGVSRGNTISTILEPFPALVPPIALRLIRVGEETATLGEMLLYLAGFYEQEVDDATRNLATLLEPLLIMLIGLMVGGLAISILGPIYKVVSAI